MDNVTYTKINGFNVPITTRDGIKESKQIKDAYLIVGLLDCAELIVHRPIGFYSESECLKKLNTTWNISYKATGCLVMDGGKRRKKDKPKTRAEAVYLLQELIDNGTLTDKGV